MHVRKFGWALVLLLAGGFLQTAHADESWGAVAAGLWRDGSGTAHVAVGSGIRYPSKSAAEQEALHQCEMRGQNCEVVGTWNKDCGYIAPGSSDDGVHWGMAATEQGALNECQAGGYECKNPIGGCVE
jgi:hypothetical protein